MRFIIVIVISILPITSSSQFRVVGYYPSWLRYELPPDKIQFGNVTHIIHAFAWPNANGTLSMYDNLVYHDLNEKAHSANKKILIALGGWGQSDGFAPMAADSSARANFVNNVIDFIETYEYDGVDLDWEYPENSTQKKNCTKLVKELREEFDDYGQDWLITMAVPVTSWRGTYFDFDTLRNYVDWFNGMTYDFFGEWVGRAGHNSPLYPPAQNNNGSVHAGITYLSSTRSVPKEQILLGIPFYGRGCDATGYNKPNTGGNKEYRYSEVAPIIGKGWIHHWDDVAKVPYLMNDASTKFISFDDTTSVRLKCEYAIEKNLSGVMIWALGQDMIGDDQPLLETVGKAMTTISIDARRDPIPYSFKLYDNYPNPFNRTTVIEFDLPYDETVDLSVYDISGQWVVTLHNGSARGGRQSVSWDATEMPSGIYFCRLATGTYSRTRKILLVK